MLSQKQLKYLKSLHQRKFRQKYGILVAEGVKTATEIFRDAPAEVEGIYALPEWLAENAASLRGLEEKTWSVTTSELAAISQLKTPNQVVCLLRQSTHDFRQDDLSGRFCLYLDEIRDPGNMGTILRIADWFGIKWVFCSHNCVEVANPKVVQASMGAFLRIKTQIVSLSELKSALPELPILGTSLSGNSILQTTLPQAGIVVIGNESTGISTESEALLTQKLLIPRHPDGGAESLNAAVATGIICAFLQRP